MSFSKIVDGKVIGNGGGESATGGAGSPPGGGVAQGRPNGVAPLG
jgi:hypothetical protein